MALKDPYFAVKIEYHHGIANYLECKNEAEARHYLDEIKRDINNAKRVYHYYDGNRLISLENVRNVYVIDHDEAFYPAKLDPDTLFKLTRLK